MYMIRATTNKKPARLSSLAVEAEKIPPVPA